MSSALLLRCKGCKILLDDDDDDNDDDGEGLAFLRVLIEDLFSPGLPFYSAQFVRYQFTYYHLSWVKRVENGNRCLPRLG